MISFLLRSGAILSVLTQTAGAPPIDLMPPAYAPPSYAPQPTSDGA